LPTDPTVEMGAISFKALYDQCLSYVESGRAEGARLVAGGHRPAGLPHDRGYFMRPALFDDVGPAMRIAREEIFGPILSVLCWEDEEEMLEIANGLDVGLTAVILTNDVNLALRAANKVKAGYVEINNPVSHAPGSPFGGIQMSGFGREGSIDELLSYTQTKSISVNGNG
jgi:acyl-CoA reductase-like NAD-dependent aldehyde dehydrogenase